MNHMVPVQFNDQTLWGLKEGDDVLVALKPICENLSIDWEAQRQRLMRDTVLSKGAVIIQVPSPGGTQDTTCLPLKLLPGFLFGIDDRRIRDEAIRARLITYKLECYDVLARHFLGSGAEAKDAQTVAEAVTIGPLSEVNTCLRMVEVAERLSGRDKARWLWRELGLPEAPADVDVPATQAPDFSEEALLAGFIGTVLVVTRDVRDRLTPSALTAAFLAYCKQVGRTPFRETTFLKRFAKAAPKAGIHKHKSYTVIYLGVRISADWVLSARVPGNA